MTKVDWNTTVVAFVSTYCLTFGRRRRGESSNFVSILFGLFVRKFEIWLRHFRAGCALKAGQNLEQKNEGLL